MAVDIVKPNENVSRGVEVIADMARGPVESDRTKRKKEQPPSEHRMYGAIRARAGKRRRRNNRLR